MIVAREEWCSFCNKNHPVMIGGCDGIRKFMDSFKVNNNELRGNLQCANCPNNKPGAVCHCTLGGSITY